MGGGTLITLATTLAVNPADAATITTDIIPFGSADGSSGTATFETINPIAPNTSYGNQPASGFFSSINVTLNNLVSSPTTTTFTLSDITNVIFRTDGGGNIIDLNFGANNDGNNGDYIADGISRFTFQLNDLSQAQTVNDYQFTNVSTSATAVPEPMTILGTLTALGFGTVFKRRQRKA